MTDHFELLQELFEKARQLPPGEEREQFIEAELSGRAELRGELEALLAAQDGASELFPSGTTTKPSTWISEALLKGDASITVGSRLGPYRILQKIGEGGFGQVFMGEQLEPIRRKVAIKIVKPSAASKQVLARFAAERQALAMMDHPNIAKIFDAGETKTGLP